VHAFLASQKEQKPFASQLEGCTRRSPRSKRAPKYSKIHSMKMFSAVLTFEQIFSPMEKEIA
jgi:hypothetical protein